MKAFLPSLLELEDLAHEVARAGVGIPQLPRVNAALNGQVSEAFRRVVSLADRKRVGAFFTTQALRERIVCHAGESICAESILFDPACGAGDLILPLTERLPVSEDLEKTLDAWGSRLYGYDLHPEFIRATRARLVLAAASRCKEIRRPSTLDLERLFPNIRQGDSLHEESHQCSATHIVLNPPYTSITAPKNCQWGTGNISSAAAFLDKYVTTSAAGTRIIAILPDVLRTGSRYKKWRRHISKHATILNIEVYGEFDSQADVDVFIVHLITNNLQSSTYQEWWHFDQTPTMQCLNDYLEVAVGPVVPHRDSQEGDLHPYLHARISPPWEIITEITERRQYSGRTVSPPFVVVRRTSSPSDKSRAAATLVIGADPVAVENHLLILVPRDRQRETCEAALSRLKHPLTDEWLNQRIRCRHLTVESIRELPWWDLP